MSAATARNRAPRLRRALTLGAATLGLLAATTASASAAPPEVLGEAANGVTPTTAFLEGYVTPNEQTTTCKFEYGTSTAYGTTVPCEPEIIEGGEQLLGANLTGLTPGTVYHYRVVLENTSAEKAEGADAEFATPALEAPIVTSEALTARNTSEPKLEAHIIPNYQVTTYKFEYATSEAELLAEEGTVINGAEPLPAVFEELQAGPVALHGLEAGPTYYYRVVATNATGTTHGAVETFQALAAPLASTAGASGMTRTTATVAGAVTPQGLPTTYQILYIPQAAYEAAIAEGAPNPYATGHLTPAASVLNEAREPALDYSSHPVQALLEELEPNTTYDYAVLASNKLGSARGNAETFTTSAPTPPVASTDGAENVSQLSATLTGNADTRGLTTVARFEFGTTPGAGTLLSAAITSTSQTSETLAATLNGVLAPNTTYYYRLIATNQDGTSYGSEQSFTTSAFPPPPFNVPTTNIPILHYATIAELNAKEAKEHHGPTHHHGPRKHKPNKALKACHKDKPKSKRAACERRAKHKHGA